MSEHPMEVARRALREAALMEGQPLRHGLLRIVEELPDRRHTPWPPAPSTERDTER